MNLKRERGQGLRWPVAGLAIAAMAVGVTPAATAQSLAYQVPKELLVIDATKTTKDTTTIVQKTARKDDGAHDIVPALIVQTKTSVSYAGQRTLRLVGDPKLAVPLDLPSRPLADTKAAFDLRDGTILKGVNVATTGRLGDIITSVAKFAGFALAIAGVADATPPTIHISKCDVLHDPLKDLPDTVRYFLQVNETACETWRDIQRRQEQMKARTDERSALEEKIKLLSGRPLADLLSQLKGLQEAIDAMQKEVSAAQGQFADRLAEFAKTLKLGEKSTTEEFHQIFELPELPTDGVIEDGASDGEIRAAIETKYPKAYAFFTKAHTIVTLSAPIPPGGVGGGAANATTPVTLPDVATKGKAFPVCFRQGEFLRLRLFAAVDDATHVTQVSDANENIMYPTLPVACMTFSPSALADRSLAITFDDKGRPSHVERSAKSDIAALAAALASSAATLRDEYAATLSKLVDIDTSKRALALNDLTTKLETLKKQKDILDTQLTVEANTANFTTSLEQKQAEAALSGLQAQITLDVARASADQQRDIGQIKTALELLNKQIELLKAQIEMDKTKR